MGEHISFFVVYLLEAHTSGKLETLYDDFSDILDMEQIAPCFSPHILWILMIVPLYHDFFGPRWLQGTHMDILKPKKSKPIIFTVRGGFFTFWVNLAHGAPRQLLGSLLFFSLQSTAVLSLKVNWFQKDFLMSSFGPKNQQHFFKDFCPCL